MAYVAISSDLGGTIFSIDHQGDLYRNAHAGASTRSALVHHALGVRVGSGWGGVQQLTASRRGALVLLAGIGAGGSLVTTTTLFDGTSPWPQVAAPQPTPFQVQDPSVSANLNASTLYPLRSLFAASNGVLFLTTRAGALLQLLFRPGATSPATLVPDGWAEMIDSSGWASGLAYFTNGDGVFFDVTASGTLRYQLSPARPTPTAPAAPAAATTPGTPTPSPGAPWTPLPGAWSRYHHVFGGGPGTIYAIASEGKLERYPYTVSNRQVQLGAQHAAFDVATGLYPWAGLSADIEGYCWPMSVAPGERVDFKVGVRLSLPPLGVDAEVEDPARYTVEIRRLRRMKGGVEADYDEVMPTPLNAQSFVAPRYALPADLLSHGAGWSDAFSLTVPDLPPDDPNHWRSGLYAARLTDGKGHSFYVSFVVRATGARAPFAILANTNTWNTYNMWGGYGKYSHAYPVPETLPFLRPHPGLTPDVAGASSPTVATLSVLSNSCHLLRAELWVLGWLEDQGARGAYDLFTDQDLHEGRTGIGDGDRPAYAGLILNTHPEYWTRTMYDRVKRYVEQGGSVVYLGGNGIYEEVTLGDDPRHLGIFPGLDRGRFPVSCRNEQLRLYCLMRTPAVGRPEHAIFGVGYFIDSSVTAQGQPYELAQDPLEEGANPALAGVPLPSGGVLGATSVDQQPEGAPGGALTTFSADGWEVDMRGFGTPPEAYAPNALLASASGSMASGEMLAYDTAYGGTVFAAASLNFGGAMVLDPNLQTIVRNVLARCRARHGAPDHD
jgi:hypothetical protein